jgi:hypothetical protein
MAVSVFFGKYSEIFALGLDEAQPTAVTSIQTNQGVPLWSQDGNWSYLNRRVYTKEASEKVIKADQSVNSATIHPVEDAVIHE